MSNDIIKAAFKTKITRYQLVHRVTRWFSCITCLLPSIVKSLSYIIICLRLLSCNFGWTQNKALWRWWIA